MRKVLKSGNGKWKKESGIKILLLAAACCVFTTICLYSSTPNKIKYQGSLKEKGVEVNGTKTMKFRITNSDGTIETWTSGNVNVAVEHGVFSYDLNVSTTIVWGSGGYYLEMTIDDQLLLPREEIGASIYALHAKNIDDGIVVTAKITDGAVTPAKTNIVSISKSTGKIPALTSAYFENLDGSALTNISGGSGTIDTVCRVSTGTIQTQVNNIAASTGTMQTQLNAVALSTGTIAGGTIDTAVRTSTGSIQNQLDLLDMSVETDTNTLRTTINEVAQSTGTIQTQVNNIAASTGTMQTQLNAVALSTGTIAGGTIDTAVRTSTGSIQNQLDLLDMSVETDTNTLRTAINTVATSTGTLQGKIVSTSTVVAAAELLGGNAAWENIPGVSVTFTVSKAPAIVFAYYTAAAKSGTDSASFIEFRFTLDGTPFGNIGYDARDAKFEPVALVGTYPIESTGSHTITVQKKSAAVPVATKINTLAVYAIPQ